MENEVVREIMNGVWFVLSVEVWLALAFYLIRKIIYRPESGSKYLVEPCHWYRDPGTQLGIALIVYMTGSGMRAGWVWVLLECQNELGRDNCQFVSQHLWPFFVASLFAIVGGICAIRILVPFGQPWNWVLSAMLAVVVPVVVHLL